MSTEATPPQHVDTRFSTRSIVLAPCAVLLTILVAVGTSFTPLVFVGPRGWVAVFCGAGVLAAILGLVLGVIGWLESTASRVDATGRQHAINRAQVGVVLNGLVVIGLVFVWVWLPGQLVFNPLWT